MSGSNSSGRTRYPASIVISAAIHGVAALVLGLVIVTEREALPVGFAAELVVVPEEQARERPPRLRRVPRPVDLTDAFATDMRPRRASTQPDVAYAPIQADATGAGVWADGSTLVRARRELPPARISVPVRASAQTRLAPSDRALDPKPIVPDQALPGLSSLVGRVQIPAAAASPLPEYFEAIERRIRQYQQYPRFALESGLEGTAMVVFTIERTGRAKDISLWESSGYKVLDDAATETIRDASPFPPFPEKQTGDEVTCSIRIQFQLDDRE
jgi:protein TonB